jgi:hypothetical protein
MVKPKTMFYCWMVNFQHQIFHLYSGRKQVQQKKDREMREAWEPRHNI